MAGANHNIAMNWALSMTFSSLELFLHVFSFGRA